MTLVAGAWLALMGTPVWASAQIHFDLRAQPLAVALTTVGNIAHINVLFDSALVDDLQAPPLKDELSAEDALRRLLAGTRLRVLRVNDKTMTVVTEEDAKRIQALHEPDTGALFSPESLHLAYASTDVPADRSASYGADAADAGGADNKREPDKSRHQSANIDEVLVTAQKRTERVQDVPIPVTAIDVDTLIGSNQLRLQDYYTKIPGMTLTPASDGSGALITIRGVSTGGYTNPTVGVVVDDVPYGSSTVQGGGYAAPDIDPSELARVEVLRGPQGTLYGANSIGGLIKFVTVDPSTAGFSGSAQVASNGVYNGNGLGFSVRGSLNAPVSDTFAVRASAFKRRDPGYIDDPSIGGGVQGVNQRDADGGRLAALWKPSEDLSVKLSALLQHLTTNGSSDVFVLPELKDLQHTELPDTGSYDKKFQSYSAVVTANMGGISLTSISGYSINRVTTNIDVTPSFGTTYTEPAFGPGITGTPDISKFETKKFTQEIRLSMPIGQRFDWLFGLFYTHEDTSSVQDILAADPVTGAVVGTGFHFTSPTPFTEYAAFTDITVHVTDRFDVQFGGRESQNKQSYSGVDTGPLVYPLYGQPSPLVQPRVDSKDNAFTYLVTPRFKVSPDIMLYARLASGYRPGGPNTNAAALRSLGLPSEFNSDKTQNYEIGIKGDALDRAISFDASVYYIDWKDIQLELYDPTSFTAYFTNASRATSRGVELSTEIRPLTGLRLAAWIAWNRAELSEAFPANGFAAGAAGDRLPYSSKISGNVSADQDFSLTSRWSGFVGGSVSYVGDREGNFASSFAVPPVRQYFPAFAQIDLHGGVRSDPWTVNLFVTNVADRRGAIGGGLDSVVQLPYLLTYIQPRTYGVSVTRAF
jgi:outer membrane receptor protein involved in Fe transport